MKLLLLIAFNIFAIAGMGFSQKINVPSAVTNAFKAKFPTATNVKWGKENAKEFEAEFKQGNTSVSANFKTDGSWVETETVIPQASLPAAVSAAILKKYPGAVITMAEKTEMPGKIIYEAAIKVNGKKKNVELNADGSFVK